MTFIYELYPYPLKMYLQTKVSFIMRQGFRQLSYYRQTYSIDYMPRKLYTTPLCGW